MYSISLSDRKFHCTVNLINQYILRETFGAWIVVTVVLFVIVMTNQFAEILGEAASDQLPKDAVFGILGLASLQYLTALTPIGLFLGVMLALARLNRDSEMSAIMACGIGICQGCTVEKCNSASNLDTYRNKYELVCMDGPIYKANEVKTCLL